MALTMKRRRCAECGSSDLMEVRGACVCRTCGGSGLMSEGDAANINRVVLFGGSEREVAKLRSRYPHLGITVRCGSAVTVLN